MSVRAPVVQPIALDGRLVAFVAGGAAVSKAGVAAADLATVQAMCLFALEVQAGDREAPYSQARALAYAARTSARREDPRP